MNWTSSNLTVRVGCRIAYETSVPTPALFVLRPRLDGQQLVRAEKFSFGASLPSYEFTDVHGNLTYRVMLMPGRNELLHDALVAVSALPDNHGLWDAPVPVEQLRTALWSLPRLRPRRHRAVPRLQSARALRDGTPAGHRLRGSGHTDGFSRLQ